MRNSRYMSEEIFDYEDSNGNIISMSGLRFLVQFKKSDMFSYVLKESDRLDIMAHRLYGDAKKWWIIADANAEYLDDPFILPVGEVIWIPNPNEVFRKFGR